MLAHILKGESELAQSFFNENKGNFISEDKAQKAIAILDDAKEGLKMNKYYKFSK